MKRCIHCNTQKTDWCIKAKCEHANTIDPVLEHKTSKRTPKFGVDIVPTRRRYTGGKIPQRVLCVSTGKEYTDAVEASEEYDVSHFAIMQACRGTTNSCSGLFWKYVGADRKPHTAPNAGIGGQRLGPKPKKVISLTTGVIYDSCPIAAEATGLGISTIQAQCLRPDDTTKPKFWSYYKEV